MNMVQNHIHLSTTLGSAPENAPDIKWKVRSDGWLPVPNIVATHRRTIHGKLKKHRLRNSSGDILRFMDYKYIIKVADYDDLTKQERLDALIAMQGEVVYLVDNMHTAADGADHTAEVKTMYFKAISDIKNINPQLDPLYITIELVDNSL
jgi:hypothetical protein